MWGVTALFLVTPEAEGQLPVLAFLPGRAVSREGRWGYRLQFAGQEVAWDSRQPPPDRDLDEVVDSGGRRRRLNTKDVVGVLAEGEGQQLFKAALRLLRHPDFHEEHRLVHALLTGLCLGPFPWLHRERLAFLGLMAPYHFDDKTKVVEALRRDSDRLRPALVELYDAIRPALAAFHELPVYAPIREALGTRIVEERERFAALSDGLPPAWVEALPELADAEARVALSTRQGMGFAYNAEGGYVADIATDQFVHLPPDLCETVAQGLAAGKTLQLPTMKRVLSRSALRNKQMIFITRRSHPDLMVRHAVLSDLIGDPALSPADVALSLAMTTPVEPDLRVWLDPILEPYVQRGAGPLTWAERRVLRVLLMERVEAYLAEGHQEVERSYPEMAVVSASLPEPDVPPAQRKSSPITDLLLAFYAHETPTLTRKKISLLLRLIMYAKADPAGEVADRVVTLLRPFYVEGEPLEASLGRVQAKAAALRRRLAWLYRHFRSLVNSRMFSAQEIEAYVAALPGVIRRTVAETGGPPPQLGAFWNQPGFAPPARAATAWLQEAPMNEAQVARFKAILREAAAVPQGEVFEAKLESVRLALLRLAMDVSLTSTDAQ